MALLSLTLLGLMAGPVADAHDSEPEPDVFSANKTPDPPTPSNDRPPRTYDEALTIGTIPSSALLGYFVGGRVMGRFAKRHELGLEVGYVAIDKSMFNRLSWSQFTGTYKSVLTMAAYELVFRPDRVVRPQVGFSAGTAFTLGRSAPPVVGVFMATGGTRFVVTSWCAFVLRAYLGGATWIPYVAAGLGGGVQFSIPTRRKAWDRPIERLAAP